MKITSAERAVVFQAILVAGIVATLELIGLDSDVARGAAFVLWVFVSAAQYLTDGADHLSTTNCGESP